MKKATRKSRPEQNEDNRCAVLAAADAVFRQRGYTAASLDLIADAAGFSKGVVYSRFGSKADLFLALLAQRIEQRAELHAQTLRNWRAKPHRNADEVLERMAGSGKEDGDWQLALLEFRLVAARDPALNARYAALHAVTIQRLAGFLEEFAESRGVPLGVSPRVMAIAIFALQVGAALEALVASPPVTRGERAAMARRLLTPDGG